MTPGQVVKATLRRDGKDLDGRGDARRKVIPRAAVNAAARTRP